jgi:S1-C subfamily serine protease
MSFYKLKEKRHMKKSVLSIAVTAFLLCFAGITIHGASKDIRVKVGGDFLTMDTKPRMEKGRTFVPMRAIFESLDSYLTWDDKAKTITALKGKTTIKLKIGSKTASVDGKSIELDLPAKVMDGRTMVPLRFVAEAMGAQVEWDSKERIIKIERDEEPMGNSSGNISNYGFTAENGDWIYISVLDKGLFRMRKDGQEKEKISGNAAFNINVMDGWIYFTYPYDYPVKEERGHLYKMGTKGNLLTKLTDYEVNSVHVMGDWIYYINSEKDNMLYKIRIDGKGEELIYENSIANFTVSNGWIYFKEDYDESLYKMRTNGSDKKLLCKDLGIDSCIVVDGDWVYYNTSGKEIGIYKLGIDGKDKQQILFEAIDSFNVSGGYIYYNDSYKNIYKIRVDGSNKVRIGTGIDQSINIADNWIYYKKWDSKNTGGKDYRIKGDSTLKQKLVMDGPFVDIKVNFLQDKPAPNPVVIPSHEPQTNVLSAKEVARQKDAVAYIKTFDEDGKPIGYGSGFNIDSAGIIVTNFHVIKGAYSIKCTLSDKFTFDVKNVLNYNSVKDIAILKLDGASNLPVVKLGSSAAVELAESVVAIGNPMDFQNTVSTGVISGIRNIFGVNYIQTTASISPGSSGGPLFNMHGEVVGMTTFMLVGTQNINFAVPVDDVKKLFSSAVLIPAEGIGEIQSSIYESEPNDTKEKASAVKLEIDANGILKDKKDKDYFSFEIDKPGKVLITGKTGTDSEKIKEINLALVDKDGNEVGKGQLLNEFGEDFFYLKANVGIGTYYIVLKAADSSDDKLKNVFYEISITEE